MSTTHLRNALKLAIKAKEQQREYINTLTQNKTWRTPLLTGEMSQDFNDTQEFDKLCEYLSFINSGNL